MFYNVTSLLDILLYNIFIPVQVAPLDMYTEVNTRTNLPAQIEIYATGSGQFDFLFIAKGDFLILS